MAWAITFADRSEQETTPAQPIYSKLQLIFWPMACNMSRQSLFCHQDGGSNRLGRNEVNIKDKP